MWSASADHIINNVKQMTMKKIFTLAVAIFAAMSVSADDFNLFPTTDGWLYFNTQENIDRYFGIINETDYLVDPNGKIVQGVYADQNPDYPATEADPEIPGAGDDAETGSAGSTTGAIILQPAAGFGNVNGGGIVLNLPSCSTLGIDYSSNSKVLLRVVATTNANAPMSNVNSNYDLNSDKGWKIISARYATVFRSLPSGHHQWTGIEEQNNGSDDVTIQSDKPIYVWIQNATRDTVYIHGIKVTTPKQETTGVKGIKAYNSNNGAEVYTIDGKNLGNNINAIRNHGIYIVRENGKARKVIL